MTSKTAYMFHIYSGTSVDYFTDDLTEALEKYANYKDELGEARLALEVEHDGEYLLEDVLMSHDKDQSYMSRVRNELTGERVIELRKKISEEGISISDFPYFEMPVKVFLTNEMIDMGDNSSRGWMEMAVQLADIIINDEDVGYISSGLSSGNIILRLYGKPTKEYSIDAMGLVRKILKEVSDAQ